MYNIADTLMHVLESFFDNEPKEYPTAKEIVARIRGQYSHLQLPSLHLEANIKRRLDSLLEFRIIRYQRRDGGRMTTGPRWQGMSADQLEE